MDCHPNLQEGLQEHLLSLLSDSSARNHLQRVLSVCHDLAHAFLRSKRAVRSIAAHHGLNPSDIAYDCIAELFQQDESGHYVQLNAYFDALPLREMEDGEVLGHLRRLTFAKVNDGVFRICNEFDPALGKILRNLKLAIHALRHFEETERFGETWIQPSLCDPLDLLPPPDSGEVFEVLLGSARSNIKIPELLAALSRYLRGQSDHSRAFPLMEVALMIRSVLARRGAETDEHHQQDHLASAEVETMIRRACSRVKSSMSVRYVGRGKATAETYDRYFDVIEGALIGRFCGTDGQPDSYFERLREYFPDLDLSTYRKNYKSHIEYLGRLAEREALAELKREL
jgi:hypothetical protein